MYLERISYHYTTFNCLYSILSEDRLYSSYGEISLTRDKFFHLKNSREKTGITGVDARLVLSGLHRDRYKIRPFQDPSYTDEQEERIYAKEVFDLHKFIVGIDVINFEDYDEHEFRFDIERLAKIYGFTVNLQELCHN